MSERTAPTPRPPPHPGGRERFRWATPHPRRGGPPCPPCWNIAPMSRSDTAIRPYAIALLALLLTLTLGTQQTSAHAFLDSSNPAANTVVPVWPQQITMRFT